MTSNALAVGLGLFGAAIGHVGFVMLSQQGFYGLVLPGGLAGIAAGLVKNRSLLVALVCGLIALVAGILTEFRSAPFVANASLWFFVTHMNELRTVTLLMIGLGAAIGFYGPFRNRVTQHAGPRRP